jgi:hypothetical protein
MTGVELYAVVVLGAVGAVLIALGGFLIAKALAARAEITQTLIDENATTPSGGGRPGGEPADPSHPTFDPGMPVQPIKDERTARTRIEEIKFRTLGTVGSYQSLAPDDERRQWFLNGLTIRAALGLAVMGYGVANIAMALGTALVLIGGVAVGVGVPVVLAAIE